MASKNDHPEEGGGPRRRQPFAATGYFLKKGFTKPGQAASRSIRFHPNIVYLRRCKKSREHSRHDAKRSIAVAAGSAAMTGATPTEKRNWRADPSRLSPESDRS